MRREDVLFRTRVDVPRWDTLMQANQSYVFLGSCFAMLMGDRFQRYGLQTLCNPLGVLYNPESIASLIHFALHQEASSLPLYERDGVWRCWLTDTQFSASDREECLHRVMPAMSDLRQALQSADYLFITLGTNVCYRLRSSGLVVTNCHKAPPAWFEEQVLDLEHCVEILQRIVAETGSVNPGLQIVFTVSPYRYAKYGFHGSQLAKATLLLAVDNVCRQYGHLVSYFPAYELMMDELRDYRFYAEDMLHPSGVAADYIWSRVVESTMSEEMQQYLKEYEPIRSGFLHRPAQPDSPDHQAFLKVLKAKEYQLKVKYGIRQ